MTRTPVESGRGAAPNFRNRWARWLFPIIGLLALMWYLMRVVPKPSRAAYPCQRVAAPVALGGILYWLSVLGLVSAYRYAKSFIRQNRYRLAGVCLAAGLVSAAVVLRRIEPTARASTGATPNAPIGIARGINPGRVVWGYAPGACMWSGKADGTHWWDPGMTNQAAVDATLSGGLQALTGTTNDADAWDALFHSFNQRRGNGDIGYQQSGNRLIAIKINQNPCNQENAGYYAKNGVSGASGTSGNEYTITANPHLILSLIRQLVAAGVAQYDITVVDASGVNRGWGGPRTIGDNIYTYVHASYPAVHFVDGVGMNGREAAIWPTTDSVNYAETFSGESATKGKRVCQQILDAGFFINMAIMKSHGDGPTLCFKNLYGAVDGQRHGVEFGNGTPTYYSNFIPPMGSRNLGEKTLLFMVDGLYGAPGPNSTPAKWNMSPFNGAWPSSVFLSQDACAIDSVGFDFLNTEYNLPQNSDYYIHEAASVPGTDGKKLSGHAYQPDVGSSGYLGSLGVEEHWNSSTARQYSRNLKTGTGIELVQVQPPSGNGWNLEAESLSYSPNGASASLQTDAKSSGGRWIELQAGAAGPYLEFTLPAVPAARYRLLMMWEGNTNRGILSLSVDGATVGGNLDQYAAAQDYPATAFGPVRLTEGNHVVRLTVTGKNPASSSYMISADKFTLERECGPTAVQDDPRGLDGHRGADPGCQDGSAPVRR